MKLDAEVVSRGHPRIPWWTEAMAVLEGGLDSAAASEEGLDSATSSKVKTDLSLAFLMMKDEDILLFVEKAKKAKNADKIETLDLSECFTFTC